MCDFDPPEFYSARRVTAAKPHRCEECGREIARGEKHEVVAGKWDGWFESFRTCSRCLVVRDFVLGKLGHACWAHGNMLDDLLQEVEYRMGDVPGLWFGYHRRLREVRHLTN